MYNPLLIQFDYKNINNASGQIVRAFWENVPQNDFNPTIVCAKRNNDFRSKWKLCEIDDNYQLTRCLTALRHIGLSDIVYQPDMIYHTWGKRVLRKSDTLLDGKYDYIHSLSCPMGAHKLAMEIKKKTGLPWIAQFFDPWIGQNISFNSAYFRKRFEQMEYEIAKNADYIIHTNDTIVKEWKSRYGDMVSNKIIALPLTYNTTNLPSTVHEKQSTKLVLAHIGHIYGTRTLKDIVTAVKELSVEDANLHSKLEIVVVGKINNGDSKYLNDTSLKGVFRFIDALPPDHLEYYYKESDAFIALDLNTNNCLYYPSKLMLYYYYQKPILGITTKGSVVDLDLRRSGHTAFYYGDSVGIKEYLRNFLINPQMQSQFDNNYWERFSVVNGISDYKKIIDRIMAKTQI